MLNLPDYIYNHPEQFELELKFLGNGPNADSSDSVRQPVLCSIAVPPILVPLIAVQLQIWLTTAYGETQVLTERYRQDKLLVRLKAGSSYIGYVNNEQLEHIAAWVESIQTFIYHLQTVQQHL